MEITIIGWYGTETIGDRAILAGIFNVLSEVFSSYSVRLGSLYPFYSERTVFEDYDFFKAVSLEKLQSIVIFDSRNPRELRKNIRASDLVMVGGGPLMDLMEMNMLEYAFFYARKKHIRTALFGCGWGPLKNKNVLEKALRLAMLSDVVVFRDQDSKNQCINHCPQLSSKVIPSIDPAFFACDFFMKQVKVERKECHIAVNFRDVSLEGDHYTNQTVPVNTLSNLVSAIAYQTDLPIHLVPMHNFAIGGDDRDFLTRIEKKVGMPNVQTMQVPLGLFETMEQFFHAKMCVGMRFHSVVLQTMLNGNNYIIDYTDPSTGKIIGMMRQLGIVDVYKNRYYSLYSGLEKMVVEINGNYRYNYKERQINDFFDIYVKSIHNLIEND
jgi:polysaccharide pyruvyl transferase WcaK-like protein